MRIDRVLRDKKQYLDLLLLGDEQESMVDRYLDRCGLYVLRDDDVRGLCAVTVEGEICEVKNLAVPPRYQRRGYGKTLLNFVCARYAGRCSALVLGTGESEATLAFYRACGFRYDHSVKDFFIQNYDHPIVEGGVRLTDMVYLRRELSGDDTEEGKAP